MTLTPRIAGLPELRAVPDRSANALDLHLGPLRRVAPEAWLPELQRALRPGGSAHVVLQNGRGRELRRLMKEASHYFDVEPGGGASFYAIRRSTAAASAHFDELAPTYWSQVPPHIQELFLRRKLDILQDIVGDLASKRGLDLGCGVGRYATEIRRRFGGRVVGVDPSRGAVKEARANDPEGVFVAGDALRLPFGDASFDYAYSINVLHHLKRGEQVRALSELHRVLRPNGLVVVHEMNVRNPLFRWYLRKVYPRIRTIDKGDEEFVHPDAWPLGHGWSRETTRYMTFVPDFVPKSLLGPLRKIERMLEHGRAAPYSAHYAVALRRT